MLISFTLGNFRSFNEPVMLSMKSINKLTDEERFDATHLMGTPRNDIRLLKSAAIYGANASGKSNLLRGLKKMRDLVIYSQRRFLPRRRLSFDPFAFSEKSVKEPTIFEVCLFIENDLYCYGFEFDEHRVVSEWLLQNDETLFDRPETDRIVVNERLFKEGKGLEERTGKSVLFLSVCSSFNGPIAGSLVSFFQNIKWINSVNIPFATKNAVDNFYRNRELKDKIIDLLKKANTGIEDIVPVEKKRTIVHGNLETQENVEEQRTYQTLATVHRCESHALLDINEESDGTQKVFHLATPFFRAMEKGKILVIDELDTQLHPLLLEMLLEIFHSQENAKAQMIFTAHNTYPLREKKLRRDQVWFVEKQNDLSSRLINLAEYKISSDASYEKDYLDGRYGGIPVLEIPDIFENYDEPETANVHEETL